MKKLPVGIQTFSEIRDDNYIYIIEFKVVDKQGDGIDVENSALEQIKSKNYHQKYLQPKSSNLNPQIYLIGIEFCKEDKNICSFEWEGEI